MSGSASVQATMASICEDAGDVASPQQRRQGVFTASLASLQSPVQLPVEDSECETDLQQFAKFTKKMARRTAVSEAASAASVRAGEVARGAATPIPPLGMFDNVAVQMAMLTETVTRLQAEIEELKKTAAAPPVQDAPAAQLPQEQPDAFQRPGKDP